MQIFQFEIPKYHMSPSFNIHDMKLSESRHIVKHFYLYLHMLTTQNSEFCMYLAS